jgi:hypothetical protein
LTLRYEKQGITGQDLRLYTPVIDLFSLLQLCAQIIEKRQIDMGGAVMLTGFSVLLAFNQVVIKVTNGGFQPIFSACVRSILALFVLALWMRWKGISIRPRKENFCLG